MSRKLQEIEQRLQNFPDPHTPQNHLFDTRGIGYLEILLKAFMYRMRYMISLVRETEKADAWAMVVEIGVELELFRGRGHTQAFVGGWKEKQGWP